MDALCSRCDGFASIGGLDAAGLLRRRGEQYERRSALIGNLTDLAKSQCEVCSVLSRCLSALGLEEDAGPVKDIDFRQDISEERRRLILRVRPIMGTWVRLELYSHPSLPCPWGVFPSSEPTGPNFSDEWERKVLSWTGQCASHHRCGSLAVDKDLPTRVLDISPDREKVCLFESNGAKARYACLSHCWGGHQPLQTRKASIDSHIANGFNWNDIPKTYRDAICVARLLGLRYLWIDSLCILQDDVDDWVRESSKMAEIYANGFITISATSSPDCDSGFLSYGPMKISGITTSGKPYQVLASRAPLHPVKDMSTSGFHLNRGKFKQSYPLLTRAWCFQERLLSSRLLHMCGDEMIWECRETSFCECGWSPASLGDSHQLVSEAVQTHDSGLITQIWRDIVHQYSKLSLTFPTDRLPALSGLAKQISTKKPQAKYLAGLWSDSLEIDLLWYSSTLDDHSVPTGGGMSPSWSWVERGSAVRFPTIHDRSRPPKRGIIESWFKVLDVQCTPKTADATGQVEKGSLRLETAIFETVLHEITRTDCRPETPSTRTRPNGPLYHMFVEFRPDAKRTYPRKGGLPVTCVRMALVEEFSAYLDTNLVEYVLVLERDDYSEAYTRLGMLLVDRGTIREGKELAVSDSPFNQGRDSCVITIV